MKTARDLEELTKILDPVRSEKKSIGFVPTMGDLHGGHLSLIERARKENDFVIVSIFVNPLQFGANEDYKKYPRDEKNDLALCRREKVDLVYLPDAKKFYPKPFQTVVSVLSLTERLCGKSRPGHFSGVTTVVLKLFNHICPDRAYFGMKDFQQLLVVRQMIRDLDLGVEMKACPIVREEDGLAISSRNRYLKADQRQRALVLNESLKYAKLLIQNGERDPAKVASEVQKQVEKSADKVDYVEVLQAIDLEPLTTLKGNVLIAVAAYFGKARLIDNVVVKC